MQGVFMKKDNQKNGFTLVELTRVCHLLKK